MARGQQGGQATMPAPSNGNGNGGTAIVKPVPTRLSAKLESASDRIKAALPKHLTAERLIQVVSVIHYRTPRLQECDPDTIVSSVLQGSALGLDFSLVTGEAYLVPVWNKDLYGKGKGGMECQFRPGYRGLVKLAKNAGEVVYVQARRVYEKDVFHYRFSPDLEFLHEPHRGADKGRVLDVYAYAKLRSGDPLIEVMPYEEIEEIHKRSEGYKYAAREKKQEFGPWVSDRGEMEKKTVIRRLCKSFSMSPELAEAIEADDREYAGFIAENTPSIRMGQQRGVAGLRSQLAIEADGPPLPPQPSKVYSEDAEPEIDDEYEGVETAPLGDLQGVE